MDAQDFSTAKGQGRAPPYHAYAALSTFVRDLNVNGIPPRIDRGAMAGIADSVRPQLMTGIRFLNLITPKDEATPLLRELVSAYGTPHWPPVLGKVLHQAYGGIFQLDLMTVTPDHLLDAFKPLASSEEVRRKCYSFFLAAAREADIPMGGRLTQKAKRGSGHLPTARRSRKPRKEAPSGSAVVQAPPTLPPRNGSASTDLVGQLVSKFPAFDPTWPDDIKAKWFTGFQQFMDVAKSHGNG
jgi:hypothetical protein